jgi:hypothetical protein
MTEHGLVYGFGDNSCGQIIHASGPGEHKIGRPRLVGAIQTYRGRIAHMDASNNFSAITVQVPDHLSTRQIFAWGDDAIMDTVSRAASIQGTLLNADDGVHLRGGAFHDKSLQLLDEQANGSQPYHLYAGYDNVALIQEKWNDAKDTYLADLGTSTTE